MTLTINALTKFYDLLLWIIPVLESFPRSQRFLLGNRIEESLLDIMELIIQAVYTSERMEFLKEANIKIEKLRYLVRLSKDLKFISIKKYEYISRSLNDIGKEIGGWLKYTMSKSTG